MSRFELRLWTDDGVMIIDPVDQSDPSAPVAITSPTIKEVRLYDDEIPQPLMDGNSTVATDTFLVIGQELLPVNTVVSARTDQNEVYVATVASIDETARTMTMDASVTAGQFIRDQTPFYAFTGNTEIEYDMVVFGTPVVGSDDWGWIASVDDTHPGLFHEQKVTAEVDFGEVGLRSVTYLACTILRNEF